MSQPVSQAPPKIFISYRRDDSAGHAGRLYDRLSEHFGRERIFMDVDHIEPGEDFVQVIEDAVGSAAVLLVIIGRHWLTSGDATGHRLDNPNDFVRLEIANALERNVRVIPVLVQGAIMPSPLELPDNLTRLSRRNAVELSDLRWNRDVEQLISVMDRFFAKQQEAQRKAAQEAEEQQQREAEAAAQRRREEQERQEQEKQAAQAAQAAQEAQQRKEAAERQRREAEAAEQRRSVERANAASETKVVDVAGQISAAPDASVARAADPLAGSITQQTRNRSTLPIIVGVLGVAVISVIVLLLLLHGSGGGGENVNTGPASEANVVETRPTMQTAATNVNQAATNVNVEPTISPTNAKGRNANKSTQTSGVNSNNEPTPEPRDEATPNPATPTPKPKPTAPISQGVLNGKAISKPQPPYPPIAKAARASGTVVVAIVVDESGRVISAHATSGHPFLQQAAVSAAYQARFAPTLMSGQPVKVSGFITYTFELQ